MDCRFERPQRIALVHISHCLDELRRDVFCHADDTPRYGEGTDQDMPRLETIGTRPSMTLGLVGGGVLVAEPIVGVILG
jgi:hypothetical protein